MTTGSPTSEVAEIVERLEDEAMRLHGRGIDRGCVDSSLAGNLALEAATLLQSLEARIEELEGALGDLLEAVDGAGMVKRGDFYHERKRARAALTPSNRDRTATS